MLQDLQEGAAAQAAPDEFREWTRRVLRLERQMEQAQAQMGPGPGQLQTPDERWASSSSSSHSFAEALGDRGRPGRPLLSAARPRSSSATRAARLLEEQVDRSRRSATPEGRWRLPDLSATVKAAQELAYAVRAEEGLASQPPLTALGGESPDEIAETAAAPVSPAPAPQPLPQQCYYPVLLINP